MAGFDPEGIPESMWMSVKDVVSQSLDAFKKEPVVFIPGAHNRAHARLRIDETMKRVQKFLT
jgi:hypothetical protein